MEVSLSRSCCSSSSSSSLTSTGLHHVWQSFGFPSLSPPRKSPPLPLRSPPPPPSEEPQLREHVSRVAALPLAHAGRDPLHLPLRVGAALAAEVHSDHAGLVGNAAALVGARAAVGGPQLLGAGAARQVQLLCLLGLKLGPAGLSLWKLMVAKEEEC